MKRLFILLLFSIAAPGFSQDMPLHEILLRGESWQKMATAPKAPANAAFELDPKKRTLKIAGKEKLNDLKLTDPTCATLWHNGRGIAIGDAGGKHVWAFRIDDDGTISAGDQYMALRVRPGEIRSEVSALTVDHSQRLYAAAKEGIHIYDPTGRLCGVIETPTKKKIDAMWYEGDMFYVLAGGEGFARKMTATGGPREKPKGQ